MARSKVSEKKIDERSSTIPPFVVVDVTMLITVQEQESKGSTCFSIIVLYLLFRFMQMNCILDKILIHPNGRLPFF